MKTILLFASFLMISGLAHAKTEPSDYDRQNERIGLETTPTVAKIQDVEMVLGDVYSENEEVSLSEGAQELANRRGSSGNRNKKSSSSESSK